MSIPPAAEQSTRVGEIMTTRLTTIGPHQQLSFAHSLMMWSNVRHLPVMQDGALIGMLSDRDLLAYSHAMRDTGARQMIVLDAMTSPAETITASDQVADAAARMALKRIGCLCVMDGSRLIGLVTTTDVLAERGRIFFHGSGPTSVPDTSTVMQPTVAVTHTDELLFDAIIVMLRSNIRHLPVVDSERCVIGMLSDRDIRAKVGDPLSAIREPDDKLVAAQVGDTMSRSPMLASLHTPLVDLARVFLDDRVGALPVIDEDERLVGIVSYVDLLRHVVAVRN